MTAAVDLNRIATFVRVVDEQSFTAAAKTLGLPKSSVSRSIAALGEGRRPLAGAGPRASSR